MGARWAGVGVGVEAAAGAEVMEVELDAEDAGESGVVGLSEVSRAEWARTPSVWGSLGVDDDDMVFVGSVTGFCCDDHGI